MRSGGVDNNQLETAASKLAAKKSLGESLTGARQQRGLSRETAVEQTHIPKHYLQMLEDDDYRLISDRLYLLPFLRKYASFLEIDPDETAMRLLHDVQRVDNSPSAVRLDEPLDVARRSRPRNWSKPIMFGGLTAVIIGAYIAQARHNDAEVVTASRPQSSQAAEVRSSSSLPVEGGIKSTSGSKPGTPLPGNRSDSNLPNQLAVETRPTLGQAQQSASPAMVVTIASPNHQPAAPRAKTPSTRRLSNR
jgi:cytoskeletal protein RodZ